MTHAELVSRLTGNSAYIERHRPLLMHMHIAMFAIGVAFFASGIMFRTTYSLPIWGGLLYEMPLWFWGAMNAGASLVSVLGLVQPPNSRMLAVGAFLHILHFSAIAVSCVFAGGDAAIGVWAVGFLSLHGKIFFEAARGL